MPSPTHTTGAYTSATALCTPSWHHARHCHTDCLALTAADRRLKAVPHHAQCLKLELHVFDMLWIAVVKYTVPLKWFHWYRHNTILKSTKLAKTVLRRSRLVAWHSGRTPVCPGKLSLSCARPAADDGQPLMWVTNKANIAFHPFEVDKFSSKLHLDVCYISRGGAIWWTLTKERQTCDIICR